MHDFEPAYDIYTEKPGYSWDAEIAFCNVNSADHAALVIPVAVRQNTFAMIQPAGRSSGTSSISKSPLRSFAMLVWHWAAGVLRGRPSAAYPALEPDIKAAGAEFVNAEAVVDGNMISARAWPDHPAWMREFVRLMKQRAPARELEAAA